MSICSLFLARPCLRRASRKDEIMPNRDGTGPMELGPRTGGGWGPCPTGPAGDARWLSRGGRGGRAYRNRFYATGLTGWQRAARADFVPPATIDGPVDRLAQIDGRLEQVLDRLEALEAKGSK